MLTSTCAILPCRDMERTINFYQQLGFSLQGRWDAYLIFKRGAAELHFAHNPEPPSGPSEHAAYFRTDNVDELSDEFAALDVFVDDGFPRFKSARDWDWEMRELHILDPDGHLLRMGQLIHG